LVTRFDIGHPSNGIKYSIPPKLDQRSADTSGPIRTSVCATGQQKTARGLLRSGGATLPMRIYAPIPDRSSSDGREEPA
jgi:hypothetical protein